MPNKVYDGEDQDQRLVGGAPLSGGEKREFDNLEQGYYDDEFDNIVGNQSGDSSEGGSSSNRARQLLGRERAAATGNTGARQQMGKAPANPNITRGGLGVKNMPEAGPKIQRGGFGAAGLKAKEQAADGGFFNADRDKAAAGKKKMSWKRKVAIGGIGSLVGLGGVAGFIGPGSEAFAVTNFGRLLEGFHLDSRNGQNQSRFMQQARYLKQLARGTPERSRLNVVTQKFGDTYRAKLEARGITPINEGLLGYQDGYRIDPAKYNDPGFDERSRTPEGLQQYLQEKYNYPTNVVTDANGNRILETRDGSLFGGRSLINNTYRVAGMRGGDAVLLRFHVKEAGLSLHPIKAINRAIFKTVEARATEWKKRLRDQVNRKVKTPSITGVSDQKDGKPVQGADDVNGELQKLENGALEAGDGARAGEPGSIEKFSTSLKVGIAAGGASIVAIACAFQALFKEADTINWNNINNALQQLSSVFMAAGNQIAHGDDYDHNSPVDEEQVAHLAEALYDAKTQTEATSAMPFNASLGKPLSGTDIPRTMFMKPSDTYFAQLIGGIPNINDICSVVNSPAGQVVLLGIGIVSSPAGTLFGALVSATGADSYLFEEAARSLAGAVIDSNAEGGLLGAQAWYGAKYLGDGISQSTAGVSLTASEATAVAQAETDYQNTMFKSQSFATRMFDTSEPKSFASQFLMNTTGPTKQATVSKFASGFLNIGQSVFKSFGAIFTAKVNAAPLNTRYNEGTAEIAHPISEVTSSLTANPFTNSDLVAGKYDDKGNAIPGILDGSDGQMYIDRAIACFGVTLQNVPDVENPTRTVWDIKPPSENDTIPTQAFMEDPANKCRENNDNWFRVRTFIWDTQVANAQACNQGDKQSCIDSGMIPDPNANAAPIPTDGATGTPTCGTSSVNKPGYTLKKCSDFGTTLADDGWTAYDGGGKGTVLDPPLGRHPAQCTVANGVFTLAMDDKGNTCGASSDYNQQYGYWETSMKASESATGAGHSHPTILLWPSSGAWADGELDYFETDMGQDPKGYLHCADGDPSKNCFEIPPKVGFDYGSAFHTYAIDWEPGVMTGYIDNIQWWTTSNGGAQPKGAMHQTLQLDGVQVPPEHPAQMQVDWVHVYSKP